MIAISLCKKKRQTAYRRRSPESGRRKQHAGDHFRRMMWNGSGNEMSSKPIFDCSPSSSGSKGRQHGNAKKKRRICDCIRRQSDSEGGRPTAEGGRATAEGGRATQEGRGRSKLAVGRTAPKRGGNSFAD